MRRGTLTLLLLIVLLALGAGFVDFWPNTSWHGISNPFSIHEGLDLQGGVSVLLAPIPHKYSQDTINSQIGNVENQIAQRVSGSLGVIDSNISILSDNNGNKSIDVELPGLTSGNQLGQIQTLLQTGVLEFWNTGPSTNANAILAQGTTFVPSQYTQYNPGNQPAFTGKDLDPSQVSVGTDPQTGRIQINFEMKGDAISKFGTFTAKYVNYGLTITLDRKVVSSANIQSAINGQGVITGSFTQQSAQQIVTVLQYGALPLSLQIISSETVGATLGQDSIQKSYIAAAIGLGIVMLFMLLYYRLPGLLADCALILYSLFTLAVFKLIGATLTLAGIAGFILSIGMAVDANVLIFERVKEELRSGRILSSAIDIGWKRAWPSIRDSNVSTLITCAVLFYFGSNYGASEIAGFATTLFLGVLISMFTAVVVTRTFLNLLVPTGVINHPALFGLPASALATATASLARRNGTV
ncbi:MAG TPA: protein translocase subunit SecD [Ktedonobacteraceae bacterium]|nr:protein translocase subunit SecD [Ktedonobacteraceae bacterium]